MTDFESFTSAIAPLYRIEREIGHGALGTTFLAQTGEGTPIAVKRLSPDLVAMMSDVERFIDSVERAGRLRHAALLPNVGAGVTADGDVYYAMTYAAGITARDRLSRDGMLDASEVATTGIAIAEALAVAHTAGLAHGNIAPANLHYTASGVRLADLGVHTGLVAAGVDPARIVSLMGAPQYMSPEQVAATGVDGRSDIYSLGATLYELLTGRPPFGGRTTSTVMASVLADEPASMSDTGTQAPGHIVRTVLRAIEKSPDDRWPSASAFAAALSAEPAAVEGAAPRATRMAGGCGPMAIVIVSALAVAAHHFL